MWNSVSKLSECHRQPLPPGEGDQPFSPLKRLQKHRGVVDNIAG